MALTLEWQARAEHWLRELPAHFYRPLQGVAWVGYATTEQLTVEQAAEGAFAPMPSGTAWGAKWEYAWFRGRVAVPAEAAGQRVVLVADLGAESAVYVDGIASGAIDREHREITLAEAAVVGADYELMIEAYAGHGPRVCSGGPVPIGRETVPEPPALQATVGQSSVGIWEEVAYQLYLDVTTLWDIRNQIDPNALRVAEIDAGLRDFSTLVDYELPYDAKLATMAAARERLAPLMAAHNGSTAPTLFAFGHSHIDVAWLWPLAETERKAVRTFGTQMALLCQYPEYRFLASEPHLYWMLQRHYPKVYEQVKAAVAEGRFVPEGGMWVEPDTNVPSGESLIRQFVHGKRFFQDEFGVDSKLMWLPDVFGYSGNLPQIMKGCGVDYFSTAKIFWAYYGGEPFPYNTFVWEGVDGSEVLVHLTNDYNSRTNAASLIARWDGRVQKDGIATRLVPFGFGDGGGGPTRDHIEYVRRMGDLEGVPKTQMAHPLDFFHDLERRGIPDVRYVGELYFQAHRGTYTSQARTKRGNRKSELALREAELWAVAARALNGQQVPLDDLDRIWKLVLLNQFHDIIPGSSIHRVYEEAETSYAQATTEADAIAQAAQSSLTCGDAAVTVFNSLSWRRQALVPLPAAWPGAALDGQVLPTQQIDGQRVARLAVPACGWTTLQPAAAAQANTEAVVATPTLLENALLRVELNVRGEITRLYDKESQRELAAGVCNQFRMYKDVPSGWDAWDIDSTYQATPVALPGQADTQVVASGPLLGRLQVRRTLSNSSLEQTITLEAGSRVVRFDTQIDWQESHKLLKVAFPVAVHANDALYDIQFAYLERPTHGSRQYDRDRFEVPHQKWVALAEANRGCAVLNDCKYGSNTVGHSINLTLLKSALAPDMTADKGQQQFSYAFYAWNGSLDQSGLEQAAYELNCPVTVATGAAGERSLFQVSAPNVLIETVKPAEDGSDDVVVRLYESQRMATRCVLATSLLIGRAAETNMLEQELRPLAIEGGRMALDLRPFEIKTLRLTPA
jgi:alpha-mannosidase